MSPELGLLACDPGLFSSSYMCLSAFKIFLPFYLRTSSFSPIRAFFRCDRCDFNTQAENDILPVSYLPFVRFLKNSVITRALAVPLLFRTMSRNSPNSMQPEPSSSTSSTKLWTSYTDSQSPKPIRGPLISSTPIEPDPSSSKLAKHSRSFTICSSEKSRKRPFPC